MQGRSVSLSPGLRYEASLLLPSSLSPLYRLENRVIRSDHGFSRPFFHPPSSAPEKLSGAAGRWLADVSEIRVTPVHPPAQYGHPLRLQFFNALAAGGCRLRLAQDSEDPAMICQFRQCIP